MKLPQKFAAPLFALILSGIASLLVSGIATWRASGLVDGFATLWLGSWIPSWCVAFPVIYLLAPSVRKFVASITERV